MKGWKQIFALLLICLSLAGCRADGITQETKKAVVDKTEDVIKLYSDVKKVIQENSIEVDQSFKDMKQQLAKMQKNVKEKIDEAEEEDGKQALEELEKIRNNLNEAKRSEEKHIVVQ